MNLTLIGHYFTSNNLKNNKDKINFTKRYEYFNDFVHNLSDFRRKMKLFSVLIGFALFICMVGNFKNQSTFDIYEIFLYLFFLGDDWKFEIK